MKQAAERLLDRPIKDLSFFADSNPQWRQLSTKNRVSLLKWAGDKAGQIPRTHEPASTSLPPDRTVRMLVARCLDPRASFRGLEKTASTGEVQAAYAKYLKAAGRAMGVDKPLELNVILAQARVVQRALWHENLSHVKKPAAYIFGSTTMGWARPKKSDLDVVFADDYFQHFYDRGKSGGFAKAAVDTQIYQMLRKINPREDLFHTTSTMVTPTEFAVTSPIMLKVEPKQISLVLFPYAYKTGKNRLGAPVFEVDLARERSLTLPLERRP